MFEYRNIIRFRKASLLALALAACACSPAAAQDQRSADGGTWAGTISISHTWEEGGSGVTTSTVNLRLRETRQQSITDVTGRVIGSKTTLLHEASSIRENYTAVWDLPGDGNPPMACEGAGSLALSGEAGTIWRNSSGADASGVVGFPLPAEGTYFIDLQAALNPQYYTVRCANGGTLKSAFTAPPIGMGVPEDPGRKIEDRGARMRGSYRGNWNAGQIQVTWDLRQRIVSEVVPRG